MCTKTLFENRGKNAHSTYYWYFSLTFCSMLTFWKGFENKWEKAFFGNQNNFFSEREISTRKYHILNSIFSNFIYFD